MADVNGPLGERLRQLRLQQGLTLRELAERVGKSESFLSRVERGQLDLSLNVLKEIADQLGRPVIQLLDNGTPGTTGLIRQGEHRKLVVSPDLQYDILCTPNSELSLFRIRLRPGGDSGHGHYRHQGIETGVVLQGTVRVIVGDREYILREGDSLTYSSTVPHRFENIGEIDAIGIWCVVPPTF